MRKKNRMSWTECSSQTVCGRTISAESDPLLLNFQQHPNQEHRLKWMMIAKTLVHFVLSWLNNTDRQTDRPLASDHYRSEWLSLSSLFSSIHHHQLWYNRSSQLEVKKRSHEPDDPTISYFPHPLSISLFLGQLFSSSHHHHHHLRPLLFFFFIHFLLISHLSLLFRTLLHFLLVAPYHFPPF